RYRTSQGNVKARLRMALGTYYVANMVNGLVLSTDNYSEYWMGFWTLHGDVGDFGMIQELWKGDELIQIAEYLDIPREILAAAPTDGLGVQPGGDEAQLGAPYPIVDRVLKDLLGKGIDLNGDEKQLDKLPQIDGIESELVKKIAKRALNNAFKRRHSVNLSRKDLGLE
ncbi:MAG: NAD(+) synthase, partial [Candidatus Gracilibacteria bacterium]|nr:NAD(+) synthase [Candidatus Gracilibacteria bacterium]